MGLFNSLFKKSEPEEDTVYIHVGDWVTQYSAGYWLVVDIIPKYAAFDYCRGDISWKKGERRGDWIILKKGFTPKMKPSNACECVDSQICYPVSQDIHDAIEAAFAENPKAKEKFDKASFSPRPYVSNHWMQLDEDQADSLRSLFTKLPGRFTEAQFWTLAEEFRKYEARPGSANHILNFSTHLWDIDSDFQPYLFGPELKKL